MQQGRLGEVYSEISCFYYVPLCTCQRRQMVLFNTCITVLSECPLAYAKKIESRCSRVLICVMLLGVLKAKVQVCRPKALSSRHYTCSILISLPLQHLIMHAGLLKHKIDSHSDSVSPWVQTSAICYGQTSTLSFAIVKWTCACQQNGLTPDHRI